MTTSFHIPTLSTKRIVLRAFQASDFDPFAAMEANPQVRRFRGGQTLDRVAAWTSMQMHLGQWALRGYGVFALEDAASSAFLGFSGILHPMDWRAPELAYSIDEPYWGRGLATEAAVAVRDWAFAQRRFDHLVSYIHPENVVSKAVAARLGAVQAGQTVLRNTRVEIWQHPAPGRGVIA
jgi:RimJ/RimL family protein N-acetyltransferase